MPILLAAPTGVGTITAVAAASPLRVEVTVSGWSSDGALTLSRVHPDGTRWPVRGVPDVSGGTTFVADYEAPFAVPVYYEATNSSVLVWSSPVTVPLATGGYLSVPGLPSLATAVQITAKPAWSRGRARTVVMPAGGTSQSVRPIVMSGPRGSRSFSVVVRTYTAADAAAVDAVLDWPVILLRMPGIPPAWAYVAVSGEKATPMVHFRAVNDADEFDAGGWYEWALDCVEVDPPVGDNYGDPLATWQALVNTGKSWQDLVTAGKTWLDILRGDW